MVPFVLPWAPNVARSYLKTLKQEGASTASTELRPITFGTFGGSFYEGRENRFKKHLSNLKY